MPKRIKGSGTYAELYPDYTLTVQRIRDVDCPTCNSLREVLVKRLGVDAAMVVLGFITKSIGRVQAVALGHIQHSVPFLRFYGPNRLYIPPHCNIVFGYHYYDIYHSRNVHMPVSSMHATVKKRKPMPSEVI